LITAKTNREPPSEEITSSSAANLWEHRMNATVEKLYNPGIQAARQRFAANPALVKILSADAELLEIFLIQFSSYGVGLTRPVEDWLRRSAARCEQVGYPELGQALRGHAKQEAGHDQMMVQDTHALVARWNARRTPQLRAEELLDRPVSAGGRLYQQLHEDAIASEAPYVQIAIEYEIELLPVQYGEAMLRKCQNSLGDKIIDHLSFLKEHITLDVAHSRFNEHQLGKFLEQNPHSASALIAAGSAALDAYAGFLHDCIEAAGAVRSQGRW
jgi:hypothetical protein